MEAVVLTSVVMIFVLLVVACGRYEATRDQVIGAARAAAEAAAIVPSASLASKAASAAAAPELALNGASCKATTVTTGIQKFKPGGDVSVTVTCSVDLSDLGVPGLPGQENISVTQVAPIDPYRVVS